MTETEKLRKALKENGIKYKACDRGGDEEVSITEWVIIGDLTAEYVEHAGRGIVGGAYHFAELRFRRGAHNPLSAADVANVIGLWK